jgi:hypothetical protein
VLDYLLEGLQRNSHPAHKHILAAIYHLYTAVYLGARYTLSHLGGKFLPGKPLV